VVAARNGVQMSSSYEEDLRILREGDTSTIAELKSRYLFKSLQRYFFAAFFSYLPSLVPPDSIQETIIGTNFENHFDYFYWVTRVIAVMLYLAAFKKLSAYFSLVRIVLRSGAKRHSS
jgi:hypothetical protein